MGFLQDLTNFAIFSDDPLTCLFFYTWLIGEFHNIIFPSTGQFFSWDQLINKFHYFFWQSIKFHNFRRWSNEKFLIALPAADFTIFSFYWLTNCNFFLWLIIENFEFFSHDCSTNFVIFLHNQLKNFVDFFFSW